MAITKENKALLDKNVATATVMLDRKGRFDSAKAVNSDVPVIARIASSSQSQPIEVSWRGRSVATHSQSKA